MGAVIWQKVTTSDAVGGGIQMGSYPRSRFLNGTAYEFTKQPQTTIIFEGEIQKQPYIFKDLHALDKKVDIKNFNDEIKRLA